MKEWITTLQAYRAYAERGASVLASATTSATCTAPESSCHQTNTCPYWMPCLGSLTRYCDRNLVNAMLVPMSKKNHARLKNCVTRPQMPSACAEGRMNEGRIRF